MLWKKITMVTAERHTDLHVQLFDDIGYILPIPLLDDKQMSYET